MRRPCVSGPGAGSALGAAEPLCSGGFVELLRPFAPLPRRVAVAVSGGADSMALAMLLRGCCEPLGLIVDHGLRSASGEEAALTGRRLAGLGIDCRIVRLALGAGPDLGARARAARYAALLALCRAEGRPDLFLGHHAADQAETQILRARRGSGPAGLAGMAAISFRGSARLLRPLLGVAPGRLRATLVAAGLGWVDDPGNTDPGTARGALRQAGALVPEGGHGAARAIEEAETAAELAGAVTLYAAGYARVERAMSARAWSALIWTLSGREHPPAREGAARLARLGQGTLGNVLVRGRYAVREVPGAPIRAEGGAVWDGRFVLSGSVPGAVIGALGDAAPGFRARAGLPNTVLRRFPALWQDGKLLAAPHLDFSAAEYCRSVTIGFRPVRPLAGSLFVPGEGCAGPGDAHGATAPYVVSHPEMPQDAGSPGARRSQGLGNAGIE